MRPHVSMQRHIRSKYGATKHCRPIRHERRPRSSLRALRATSPTFPITSRALGHGRAKDHAQTRRTWRERSCEARSSTRSAAHRKPWTRRASAAHRWRSGRSDMNGAPPWHSGRATPASLRHQRVPHLNTGPANRQLIKRRCERVEAGSIARARRAGCSGSSASRSSLLKVASDAAATCHIEETSELAAGIAAAATRCFFSVMCCLRRRGAG